MREGLMTCVLSVKVPEPKFSSQTKDKLVSSEGARAGRTSSQGAGRVPGRAPNDAKIIVRQDRRGRPRPRGRAQGPRDDAPQGRARRLRPARQAGRLPGKGPGAVRDLHRRGRLRLAAAPSRGRDRKFQAILPLRGKILNVEKRALRQAADQQRDRHADHRAGHRHRQAPRQMGAMAAARAAPTTSTRRQAALPPHHHHDRRRRGRRPHPHPAAHLLLPPDAELVERGTSTSPSRRCTRSSPAGRAVPDGRRALDAFLLRVALNGRQRHRRRRAHHRRRHPGRAGAQAPVGRGRDRAPVGLHGRRGPARHRRRRGR